MAGESQYPSHSADRPMRRRKRLTGVHVASIFVGFFGVVIAVNVLMATLATSTFGGIVVENSYVASQHFNGWLDEAAREKAIGWAASIHRDPAGQATIALTDAKGAPLTGAKVAVDAVHPLGRVPDHQLAVHEVSPGIYAAPLAAGRWRLRVTAEAGGHVWRTVGDLL